LDNFKRVYNNIIDAGNSIYNLETMVYEVNENPKIDKMFFSAYKDIRHELPKQYFDDQTKKTMYKIKNLYANNEVKEIINKIINTELNNYFVQFFSVTKQCLGKLENLINEHTKFVGYPHYDVLLQQEDGTYAYGFSIAHRETVITQIIIDINLMLDMILYIGVMIMDLYLLRRFLDKKYITNALSYTGGLHSENYILFLVKYFNFNITHYSYLKDDNIKKAQGIIKKAHKNRDLSILFSPPLFLQCSDMTHFPPLFT
jgi:hypothetical protein